MQAMILAAGLGTRLRPYSLLRPKPLFPVLDQPLLTRNLVLLREAGCATVIVNCHYLRSRFFPLLAGQDKVILQVEEEILGTGGGLRRALDHFAAEPVLVVNGDIVHTIDLEQVYRRHCESGARVTMVLHDFPRFNLVRVSAAGLVTGFAGPGSADSGETLAFTGIHVLDPDLLRLIPAGRFYSIIDCYQAFINQGGRIRAEIVRDHFWTDMGTPADYLALHGALLTGATGGTGLSAPGAQRPIFYGADILIGDQVTVSDWAVIGSGAEIGDGATLSRVVVWDGARVAAGARLHDAIVV